MKTVAIVYTKSKILSSDTFIDDSSNCSYRFKDEFIMVIFLKTKAIANTQNRKWLSTDKFIEDNISY